VEGLGDRGVDVHHGVVVPLVDVEGEVAAGHHVDHFLDADVLDVLGLLLTHVSLDEGVHGKPPGPRLAGAGVCGLGRGGGGAVRLLLDGCGGGGGGRGGVGGGAGAGAPLPPRPRRRFDLRVTPGRAGRCGAAGRPRRRPCRGSRGREAYLRS